MKIEKVHAVYFSPTGTTKTVITHLVKCITTLLPEVVTEVKDFTLPSGRKKVPDIRESELAIVGLPVYAGRLPNLLLNYLTTWQSNGAWAVPVVVYGNRSYGNALVELYDILRYRGFHPIAGFCRPAFFHDPVGYRASRPGRSGKGRTVFGRDREKNIATRRIYRNKDSGTRGS